MPSICSGAPGTLTPSAAIKGSGSRGSEMIVIASARQPRSRGRAESERASETKTPAPSVYAKRSPPGTPASRRLARPGAQGHEPAPARCLRRAALPPLGTQRGSGVNGTERGGGVDVIGADAAVSSIMDGDDATAEPNPP